MVSGEYLVPRNDDFFEWADLYGVQDNDEQPDHLTVYELGPPPEPIPFPQGKRGDQRQK